MRKILTALHSISGWLEKHRILEKNLANSIGRNHNSSLPKWSAHFRWWSMRFNSGLDSMMMCNSSYLWFLKLFVFLISDDLWNSLAEFTSELEPVYGTWTF